MGLSFDALQELFLMQSDISSPCILGPDRIYIQGRVISTMRVIFAAKLGRELHTSWQVRNLCGTKGCKHPAHHELAYNWAGEGFEELPRLQQFDEIAELIDLIESQESRDPHAIHERYSAYTLAEIQLALKKMA